MNRFALVLVVVVVVAAAGWYFLRQKNGDDWTNLHRDSFDREELGPDWITTDDRWTLADGKLAGNGIAEITLAKPVHGNLRIRYKASTVPPAGGQFNCFFKNFRVILGGWDNTKIALLKEDRVLVRKDYPSFEPGKTYAVEAEYVDGRIIVRVDGQVILDFFDHLLGDESETRAKVGLSTWLSQPRFDDFEVAVQSQSSGVPSSFRDGDDHFRARRFAEAAEAYRKAGGSAGSAALAAYKTGLALQRSGRDDEALKVFDGSSALGEHPYAAEIGFLRALSLWKLGRVDDARSAFADLSVRFPSNAMAAQIVSDFRGAAEDRLHGAAASGSLPDIRFLLAAFPAISGEIVELASVLAEIDFRARGETAAVELEAVLADRSLPPAIRAELALIRYHLGAAQVATSPADTALPGRLLADIDRFLATAGVIEPVTRARFAMISAALRFCLGDSDLANRALDVPANDNDLAWKNRAEALAMSGYVQALAGNDAAAGQIFDNVLTVYPEQRGEVEFAEHQKILLLRKRKETASYKTALADCDSTYRTVFAQFLRGKITPDEFRARADGDRLFRNDYWFYLGEVARADGRPDEARAAYAKAVAETRLAEWPFLLAVMAGR